MERAGRLLFVLDVLDAGLDLVCIIAGLVRQAEATNTSLTA